MLLFVRILFVAHGVVTAAAGAVLIAAPALIPSAVSIELTPEANLLPYLLGAVELGVGVLSIGASRLADASAIRLVAFSFVVLHAVSAAVVVVALLFALVAARIRASIRKPGVN